LRGGTLVDDETLLQANDFGVEDEGFFDVVGDGEDGDALLRGVLLHTGKQDVAEGAIDAGEGFVEEEEVRGGDCEGSCEVDALTLSAGEIAGETVGERREIEQVKGCVDRGCVRLAADVRREGDVLAHGEVGEEDGALRSVGEMAAVGRETVEFAEVAVEGLGEANVGGRNEAAGGAEDGALAAA